MKKVEQKRWKLNYVICLLGFIFFSNVLAAQESEKGDVSLGIYGGFGGSINGFRTTDYRSYSFYDVPQQYTLGINFSAFVADNQRIRIGVDYGEMYYGINWPDEDQIDVTRVRMYNIGAKFNYDYKIYELKKLQVFASPGLVAQFVIADQSRSTREDGSYTYADYKYCPDGEYPTSNIGFDASVLLKYKVTKSIGVTFNPFYDIFFVKFDDDNSSPYMRYGGILGVDYTF